MAKTIISVKNLVKNYGHFQAVKGISFEVKEGEIFGLLGPNGAGKSTTLEIIETLRPKTSGEIMVDGLCLDKQPNEIKKIIGVQLQTSGYYPGLNLLNLIELFCGLYNRDVNPMELLEMVNLKDKAKAKVKELSGGQKQRISIARALVKDPGIVIFDDCLSAVDGKTEKEIIGNLYHYLEDKTAVIITHRIFSLFRFDQIIVMEEGKIAEAGTHDALIGLKGLYYEMYNRQQEQEKNNG